MHRRLRTLVRSRLHRACALAAASLLAGCSGDGISGPDPSDASAGARVATDVSGSWTWSNTEVVAFPAFLAVLLGVVPEGDLTHGRCESTGSMTLVQTGSTFSGTSLRETNACVTDGGQPFTQPGFSLLIGNGRVTGGSIHFDVSSATVSPCPHTAVIADAQDGYALRLSGHGRCVLPGHPRSESPLSAEPPPQGRSRATSWEAVRP